MLVALSIRNIVLIDEIDLVFGPGMSVLTGETGAGKSILLDAFALALGARGDANLVRNGASRADVTAQFDVQPSHPVFDLLAENDIEPQDGLVLRRTQFRDGRSRAFINDTPVSIQLLRRAGALLVEIHGQHEDRALVEPAAHRRLLDAFGGLSGEALAVQTLWRAWQEALRRRDERLAEAEAARRNIDYARYAHEELQALNPRPGEEEELASLRQRMQSAAKLTGELQEMLATLSRAGLEAKLGSALRRLERQQAANEIIRPAAAAVERLLIEAAEATVQIETALAACNFSEADLEAAEERLFKLREAARKHRVAVSELPAVAAKFAAEIENFESSEAELAQLEAEAKSAADAYLKAAQTLSEKRAAAAARLDRAVAKELPPLKLERARFLTVIDKEEDCVSGMRGGPSGLESVTFHAAANPGTEPGPLLKTASGGELARFILALKVVLAERGSAPTLIFDEIDTGVGGATAAAIGERLARLAKSTQILAVTHSPQVASQASQHFFISKEPLMNGGGESMVTRVTPLDAAGRREEIARMLAGTVVTEEARSAAQRLIEAGT